MNKGFVKISLAVILTICMLAGIAWVFHSKSAYHKMGDFYKYTDDYDVWFLGSSHAVMSELPEELYKEYGIRSYNLADYGQTFALDYWLTKNVLKISKPKLVVMDVGLIGIGVNYSDGNLSCVKRMITSLPFSVEKITAILDLFEGDMKEEMLLPFSSDHHNWEYLSKEYFLLEESYELGSDQNVFDDRGREGYVLVTPVNIPEAIAHERVNSTETSNSEYFRKLLELCQDNNIEVLLVKCPLATDEANQEAFNYAFAIGQEYGIPYLNGFEMGTVFDGETDMWDGSHLNSLGARKWTHALGEYISENYPTVSVKTDDETMKQRWDDRYEKYLSWLDTELPLQSYFYSFLMLCTNPRYHLDMTVTEDSPVFNDRIAMKFIDICDTNLTVIEGEDNTPEINIVVYSGDEEVDHAIFQYKFENYDGYERQYV